MVLERLELLVPVLDALHHGCAPANGQLHFHDLLQVSLVLALCCRGLFGPLPLVSFDLDGRQLLRILKVEQDYANDHAATVSRPGLAWQCTA